LPEIPDLEGYRVYFSRRLPGVSVAQAAVTIPIVVRASKEEFAQALAGETFNEVRRQGKHLLFPFQSGQLVVVHAMLSGRFQYCDPGEKRRAKTAFLLGLDNGMELRYYDDRLMGKVYLARHEGELSAAVPRWSEMGPDAMSPELTEELFVQRLQRYRDQRAVRGGHWQRLRRRGAVGGGHPPLPPPRRSVRRGAGKPLPRATVSDAVGDTHRR
jgi:formamidopyrimidine-DNA glycosylase